MAESSSSAAADGRRPSAPADEALPSAERRRRTAEQVAQAWQQRASSAKMHRTPSWQTFEQQLEADRTTPQQSEQPEQQVQPGEQALGEFLLEMVSASYWQSVARSVYQYVTAGPVPRIMQPILEAVGIKAAAPTAERMLKWRISENNSAAFRAAVRERQRRRHMGNALSTLKSAVVAPDAVIAHQKRFDDEIASIIARGKEENSFFAVNVTTIISRWTELRHSATNMHAELRVNITGDPVLITLMASLRMAMRVETIQDVDILARIAQENAHIWESFSPTPTGDTPFVWDSCPVRPSAHLAASLRAGIRAFLVDSVEEAVRILHAQKRLQITGSVNFVVLVRTRGQQSSSSSDVYGSRLPQMQKLAARLKKIRANVVGVTTIVRDQSNLESIMPTLETAIECLRANEHDVQFVSLQGLDQGAVEDSWIATNLKTQDENIQMLRAKFRIPRVFCDATRYLLADTHVLLARVIGEKPAFDADGNMVGHQYYIDDGCYGSFGRMHVTADKNAATPAPQPFTVRVTGDPAELGPDGGGSVATIWGQTCDSIDCVAQQVVLPNLELGSWLSFTGLDQTGTTYSTQFNGFPAPSKKYCVQVGRSMR